MSTRTLRSASKPSPQPHTSVTQPTNPKPQSKKRRRPASPLQPKKCRVSKPSKSDSAPDAFKAADPQSVATPETRYLRLKEEPGDIFASPPSTLLLHACNTQGTWGAGIAAAFKSHHPRAFKVYKAHCAAHSPAELVGTALLIQPQTASGEGGEGKGKGKDGEVQRWIGCLFTSAKRGKAKDSPDQILDATGKAVRDSLKQIREAKQAGKGEVVGEIWMPRINSGLFGVPWESTKQILQAIEVSEEDVKEIRVVYREE